MNESLIWIAQILDHQKSFIWHEQAESPDWESASLFPLGFFYSRPGKTGNYSVNHPDSEDTEIFVKFPGNSIEIQVWYTQFENPKKSGIQPIVFDNQKVKIIINNS